MDRWIFEVLVDGIWIGTSLVGPTSSVEALLELIPEGFQRGLTDQKGGTLAARLRNVNTNEIIPWEAMC